MPTKLVFVGLLVLSALSRPVASDATPQLCLSQFVAPKYSAIARTAAIQGSVVVKVKVHADGEISEIWPPGTVVGPSGEISQLPPASPNGFFAGTAVDAVKKWRFCPGTEGRQFDITFVFKLTDPGVSGWAPTEVSFHPSATVEISTAHNSQMTSSTKAK